MKAWQRQIREHKSENAHKENLFGCWWEEIDTDIKKAVVKPITFEAASNIILEYEWLGNMGTTEFAFGIFFQNNLGGAVCFGRTAGTNTYHSVAGEQYFNHAITLCRGACVHWAHKHSASKLISSACRMMVPHGFNIFIAYSDPEAGEIGTVYQACNWLYCGVTNPTEKFETPSGEIKDARLVSAYTRDRTGGTLKYKRTRAEQKALMLRSGYRFFKGHSKHRYVHIVARTRREEKQIRNALQWPVLPYPKRDAISPVRKNDSTVSTLADK